MECYIHKGSAAVGTCVACGKFICHECCTEINNKNYCKNCLQEVINEKNKTIEKLESNPTAPNVFMNAGGGASSSSSSSASAASSSGVRRRRPYPRQSILIHILLLFFTLGIGNIAYFLYVKSKQNAWERES